MNRAFSLVELSIVLVILGLLVGGILAGQSLIRAAELRGVTTGYDRITVAMHAFRDKYMALPGDLPIATRFWLKQTAGADCVSYSGAAQGSPGACDGNGDGYFNAAVAGSQSGEIFQFWRQLALAGLIEGNFTGQAGSGGGAHAIINTNVPSGKISSSGYTLSYFDMRPSGDGNNYGMNYGNQITFGGANAGVDTSSPIIRPEEAWNIDTKMDDGKPGTGRLIAIYWSTCGTSTTALDFAGSYRLNNTGTVCALRLKL